MRRRIISLETAYEALEPYLPDIVKCIREGFQDYLRLQRFVETQLKLHYTKVRTRACIVHENISAHFARRFRLHPHIQAGEWNGIFGLKIGEMLFLRVKKLNNDYSMTTSGTKQAQDYLKQLPIPGFPDAPTLLVAGYIPDPTWAYIQNICITCWQGETLHWIFDVEHYGAEQIALPFLEETKAVGKGGEQLQNGA